MENMSHFNVREGECTCAEVKGHAGGGALSSTIGVLGLKLRSQAWHQTPLPPKLFHWLPILFLFFSFCSCNKASGKTASEREDLLCLTRSECSVQEDGKFEGRLG